jgi:UTP:GlnB (protein PII) uridylyltransferase
MNQQYKFGIIRMNSGRSTSMSVGLQLAKELHRQLENILDEQIQVTLFGSQARGESTDESDIDVLVILPNLEKSTLDTVLDTAWEIGYDAGKVISVIPATREEMTLLSASPFFQAVQREGIAA